MAASDEVKHAKNPNKRRVILENKFLLWIDSISVEPNAVFLPFLFFPLWNMSVE